MSTSYFINLLSELKETNSSNKKKEILMKYDSTYVRQALYFIYNPFFRYNVTLKGLISFQEEHKNDEDYNSYKNYYPDNDIFSLLSDLKDSKITGHLALQTITAFEREAVPDVKTILYCALNKTLDSNLGVSILNSVFSIDGEDFIPQFKVAKAYKLDDIEKKKSIDLSTTQYRASRKMDGIRTIAIYKDNNLRFFSREGNEFFVLDKLKEALLPNLQKHFGENNIVLDGELCIIQDGKEDFKQVTKEFRKKDHTIESPMFIVFDILSEKDFYNGEGDVSFEERLEYLKSLSNILETEYSSILEFSSILDKESFEEWKEKAHINWWEGIILRAVKENYKGKRTEDLLKVKKGADDEFEVVDMEIGEQGMLNDNGVVEKTPIMASVVIMHKGNKVWVGSGFTQEERIYYMKNPNEIIGKKITVKYMEETMDKKGNYSLRHPVFVEIRNYE